MNVSQLIESTYIADSARLICPSCSPTRAKKNLKDLQVTRTHDGYRYYCHHCHDGGFINSGRSNVLPIRKEPIISTLPLQKQHIAFLSTRGTLGIARKDTFIQQDAQSAANGFFKRLAKAG